MAGGVEGRAPGQFKVMAGAGPHPPLVGGGHNVVAVECVVGCGEECEWRGDDEVEWWMVNGLIGRTEVDVVLIGPVRGINVLVSPESILLSFEMEAWYCSGVIGAQCSRTYVAHVSRFWTCWRIWERWNAGVCVEDWMVEEELVMLPVVVVIVAVTVLVVSERGGGVVEGGGGGGGGCEMSISV
eukprot:6481656-Amphidinium_carterae.2